MLSWNETHLSNVISNYTFNTSVYLKSKCNNCLNNRFGPQIEKIIEININQKKKNWKIWDDLDNLNPKKVNISLLFFLLKHV